MRADEIDFKLPRRLVAERPVRPRDAARLLVVEGDRLADRRFRELPRLLRPGDILVMNDTKVIPARLFGRRGAAAIEVTLHRAVAPDRWRAFARPARRLRPGDSIRFADDFAAEVAEKGDAGEVVLCFDRAGPDLRAALARHGRMPLPPYIGRPDGADARDAADYQTVYARCEGAIAAPTAGLHFTRRLLDALDRGGIRQATVTLHVGPGTFLPVRTEQAEEHRMLPEAGLLTAAAASAVNEARAAGGRVVAVGSTSLRLLEAAAAADGRIGPFAGDTDLFILPGYRFKAVDLLLTNFHLPRSTLFMLVCAFAGLERMRSAYRHAMREGYRFYSYGDACLLSREGRA